MNGPEIVEELTDWKKGHNIHCGLPIYCQSRGRLATKELARRNWEGESQFLFMPLATLWLHISLIRFQHFSAKLYVQFSLAMNFVHHGIEREVNDNDFFHDEPLSVVRQTAGSFLPLTTRLKQRRWSPTWSLYQDALINGRVQQQIPPHY